MDICIDCNKELTSPPSSGGTGYATTPEGKVCYTCCAVRDRATLARGEDPGLYLTAAGVTNWPGSLVLPHNGISHSPQGKRRSAYFNVGDQLWKIVVRGHMDCGRSAPVKGS